MNQINIYVVVPTGSSDSEITKIFRFTSFLYSTHSPNYVHDVAQADVVVTTEELTQSNPAPFSRLVNTLGIPVFMIAPNTHPMRGKFLNRLYEKRSAR